MANPMGQWIPAFAGMTGSGSGMLSVIPDLIRNPGGRGWFDTRPEHIEGHVLSEFEEPTTNGVGNDELGARKARRNHPHPNPLP